MLELHGNYCCICADNAGVLHSHHTVPRSRGGEKSLQINLCPTCHNAIHANALAIVSRIKNPKRPNNTRRFWRNAEEEQRAERFLQILVEALVKPIPEELEREHLLSLNVSTSLFEQFKLLQLDTGLSSQEKVLNYCIKQTLINRGIENVSSKNPKKECIDLWFMLGS